MGSLNSTIFDVDFSREGFWQADKPNDIDIDEQGGETWKVQSSIAYT